MDKLARIRSLSNGNGIKYLLDAAYELLDNPIVVFDTNYSLIAYAGDLPDDPLWKELISTGTFCMETQKFFAQANFGEGIANAANMLILKNEHLKYDRIITFILNKDAVMVANLLMCERNAFTSEDIAAFQALADIVVAEIRDDKYYTAYVSEYYEDKLRKLLDGTINEPEVYTSQLKILYNGFDDYLYLAVVDLSQCNAGDNKLRYIKGVLEEMYRTFKFTVFNDYIIMVISSKNPIFDVNAFFNLINNPFDSYNLFVGISTSFENLYDLFEYYEEAVASLGSGIGKSGSQRFYVSGRTIYT